ncbi:Galactose-3-O-sulfotransferase 3 [Mizuhopecten yessoensis]|uniref:Galactose-3-O-sulfotransferase 3 n=1 Tax=Mizuhopecten yessoensis TaxID=6573 RepID=A0A210QQ15_MIZYE|nr:Galactose-3-O-sulfotransferase 3 [Mizuhopecten yessoensis]
MHYKIGRRSLLLGFCALVTTYSLRRYINFTVDEEETIREHILYRKEGSWSQTKYNLTGNPVNHIAFIKVPKAASTTVQNIFLRYGDEQNLNFALPRGRGGAGGELTSQFFFPPPKNRRYDISCTHVKYNRTHFSRALPTDTTYIGIVREPFSHFRSLIKFTRPKFVLDMPGENPVLEYLSRFEKYRNKTKITYKGWNLMARYFGFTDDLILTMDQILIQKYLLKLDEEMGIVLVFEYLEESIVLMRRILNWDLKYVLHGKLRVNKVEDNRLKFGTNVEKLHKSCYQLDYQLYEFFVQKLKEKLKDQPPDFYDELAYFRRTRMKYEDFCLSSISNDDNNASITFEGSAWNRPFVITWEHCKKLYIHDVTFLAMLKEKQHAGSP